MIRSAPPSSASMKLVTPSQSNSMKLSLWRSVLNRSLLLSLLLTSSGALHAQTRLLTGHTDIGVAYEDGAWNLHVGRHEDNPPAEYTPAEAVLVVGPAAQSPIPSAAAFRFLGTPGAPIYVLPQAHHENLLFLGFGSEELPTGLFANDEVKVSLHSVDGPGGFIVYDVDAFGTPAVFFNSLDGLNAQDTITLVAGGHRHLNWAFTAPGTYRVALSAEARLADGGNVITSDDTLYTFEVLGVAPLLQWVRAQDGQRLEWLSTTPATYQIQRRSDLQTGSWENWGEPRPGTGALISVAIPSEAATGFFRLVQE